MCGRFYIPEDDPDPELRAILADLNRRALTVKTGEVLPTDTAAVVCNSRDMTPRPFAMRWGYTGVGSRPLINARSETAAEKPLFRDGMQQRRCLIPAGHYFEWQRQDRDRTRFQLRPARAEMLWMAGIYRMEENGPAFTILTRQAAPGIAFIHDRMPVILPPACRMAWLDLSVPSEELLRLAVEDMECRAG